MLITGLLLGTALGFAMQRGRFCVTGAFRDIWISKNTRWLTAFMVVVAIQSVGVFALDAAGVINLQAENFAWLATILGAFIFGFGIVLAGGCATGTYYRSGEGLVGSWIALAAYALFAAISKTGPLAGTTESLRAITVPLTNIHTSLGVSPWVLVALLVVGVALAVRHHLRKPKLNIASLPSQRSGIAKVLFEKPWGAFGTAVVIGIIAILAWPLSWATWRESGLGITTPSSNLASFFITGDVTLVDWGVYLVLGLLLGSFIAAWAGGCTIGNAMVNTAIFGYQGWVSLIFMIIGTGVAARVFITGSNRSKTTGTTTAAPASVSVS